MTQTIIVTKERLADDRFRESRALLRILWPAQVRRKHKFLTTCHQPDGPYSLPKIILSEIFHHIQLSLRILSRIAVLFFLMADPSAFMSRVHPLAYSTEQNELIPNIALIRQSPISAPIGVISNVLQQQTFEGFANMIRASELNLQY